MWHQVLALIVKELLAVLKDRKSRMVLIGPPLIQLMVFGYAATFDLDHVPIAVYDEDLSAESRDLVARFTGSPVFEPLAFLHSARDIDGLIDQRKVAMVLSIDRRFTRDLLLHRPARVQLIVDGTDPKAVHEILEIEVEHQEEEGLMAAKVWEAAGGYAPTVGILGAVLGLIHVMENLADPSKLGGGIAVAFVATVYGVGAANLFFLPIANKIKFKLKEEAGSRNMIIMGLVGLAQGENPRLLQDKLESFLPHGERTKETKK